MCCLFEPDQLTPLLKKLFATGLKGSTWCYNTEGCTQDAEGCRLELVDQEGWSGSFRLTANPPS